MNMLRSRAAGMALALLPAVAHAQYDPPNAVYATWASKEAAVQSLWDARKRFGAIWNPGTAYAALDPAIRNKIAIGSGRGSNVQATPDSVYLIPQVDIRSPSLPRALHHVAAALLRYDPGNAKFYPSYTDSQNRQVVVSTTGVELGSYIAFLAGGTRSRHDNLMKYLPDVTVPDCPSGVGAAVAAAWNRANAQQTSTKAAMLDALNGQSGNTNRQKWHCLAMRAVPPNSTDTARAFGYIEFDHPDGPGGQREYTESNDGRIVYDYVNGRVYYTPTHYRPTYRDATGALRISENNQCPERQICASPFFEIVR